MPTAFVTAAASPAGPRMFDLLAGCRDPMAPHIEVLIHLDDITNSAPPLPSLCASACAHLALQLTCSKRLKAFAALDMAHLADTA